MLWKVVRERQSSTDILLGTCEYRHRVHCEKMPLSVAQHPNGEEKKKGRLGPKVAEIILTSNYVLVSANYMSLKIQNLSLLRVDFFMSHTKCIPFKE